MRTTTRAIAVLFLAMSAASCHRLIPSARPPFTVTGIVVGVDAHTIDLRHKSGQRVTIAVTPQTKIMLRGAPADVAHVRVGLRIVVLYHFVDGSPTADEVRLFRT